MFLLLTPTIADESAVWEKSEKSFLEKFREFFFQDFLRLFNAVSVGLTANTDLFFNLSLGEPQLA